MDEHENDELTPDELEAEKEALADVEGDELRAKLADELGIDPDEESDLLDKLVEKEVAHHKKLSGAIKQKITWRDKAKKGDSNKPKPGDTQPNSGTLTAEQVEEIFERRMAVRELESLDLPDELKDEVKDFAKLKGISVKEAANHPYIQSEVERIRTEERVSKATPKRSGKGSYARTDFDTSKPLNPDDFDFNTKEGREAWEEAKAAHRKARQK